LSPINLPAELADPVAKGPATDGEAIGNLRQRPTRDEDRPEGLVAAMPSAGRPEKEPLVDLAVHDKPPCDVSSILPLPRSPI
jgi:hypothetical protein